MNAVYKLIFNISTGTWAVAHELASARGKKSRTRLAAAMTVALAMPAGAALAADAPLQCAVNETVSADGLRCVATASPMAPVSRGIGTMATATELENNNSYGAVVATGMRTTAVAVGNYTVAVGANADAGSTGTLGYATAIGMSSKATGSVTTAVGYGATATADSSNAFGANAAASAQHALALGTYSSATAAESVAIGYGSVANTANTVSVGNATLQRKIVNMADGALSATSKEAVNGSQLFATNGRLTTAEGNIGTLTTNVAGNTTAITNLQNGTAGLVQQDATTRNITVGAGSVGGSVSLRDANSDSRTLTGVKAGAARTDAVNVSQLQSALDGIGGGQTVDAATGAISAPTFKVGGTDVHSVGDALTNLDGRVTTAETNITDLQNQIGNGSIGLVQQDATTGEITVGGDKGGTSVNFAGVDAGGAAVDRTLTGVARGSADNDAANIGQVKDVVAGLGGGAAVNPDGSITAPSYSIGGSSYDNAGDAFTAVDGSLTSLDGRVTVNEGNISDLTQQFNDLSSGTAGIVTYDAAAGSVNVAAGQAGSVVNVAGTAGNRTIAGVADGEVSATSDEAVNGSQLNATNERVSANETNIVDLDGRMTVNEGDISNLTQQFNDLNSGSAGMVTYDAATGSVAVGANVGGDVVNMTGTDGARRLGGVANGVADTDVATIAQLKASGLVDPNNGRALGALVYDDLSLDRATLGGTNGTVIANLGNGLIAAGSREAVNGGQLWQMNADWEAKWNQMDGRVGTIEKGIADGSIGGPGGSLPGTGGEWRGVGDGSVAIGDGAAADGSGAVGIGNGADAGGAGSVAIGDGASATGDNSVAIGKGSTADRDNEYSVGSEGNERVVSNVGRGTRPTDAVNLGQMEDRFAAERDWANGRFQAVDKRMDRMGAMNAAMVNMAVSAAGVHTTNRVGAGVGFQNGKSALSVGYQRALSERATITLGGSFSGSEASAGFGAGFGW